MEENLDLFIKEEDYQEIKRALSKEDNYFTLNELQIFTEKISVILA